MIITQLSGGLGNQMFQYALGRALSLKLNTKLALDITSFDNQPHTDTTREYELDVYKLSATIASQNDLANWDRPSRWKLVLNKYLKFNLNPYPINYIKEESHKFDQKVLDKSDNTYLSGYWQSEKYFLDYRNQIMSDFNTRSQKISSKNKKLLDSISKVNSISLHVRRSDYVTNPNANKFHGTCELSYYQHAMKYIESRIKKPNYFVFSDDPAWVRNNIKSNHPIIYITHNSGKNSHEDIRLMSQCKHNIIANSSFSWWGAWLNKNDHKIVVAPKHWFKNPDLDTSDLIPVDWIKL